MHDRNSLLEALERTRLRTQSLIDSLTDGQLQVPYHPGINPPLWEIGHAAFFYEVFILKELDQLPSFDPSMDDLWDSFHIEHRDRWQPGLFPGREQTRHYFDVVYDRIAERIQTQPLIDWAKYLYRYAIFHQNMHIESLIWCRQTLGYPAPPGALEATKPSGSGAGALGDAQIPAGNYVMGMPGKSIEFADRDFAFDNEKPRFEVELNSFAISRTLVSNAEFLEFVEDGGYRRPELWSFGGRKWLNTPIVRPETEAATGLSKEAPQHPLYWRHENNQWQERLFDRWQALPPDYPVTHVSYWEAEAFCNWSGRRLPTEYEWEAAALGNRPDEPFRRFPWGDKFERGRADTDAELMAQLPVTALAEGASPYGCRQMLGTVWEWTSNQFLPYDGFAVDIYPFMSTLQFGDHKVTKGGSCATSSMLIRGTYRQAYLPMRNDVYTGFRTCAL